MTIFRADAAFSKAVSIDGNDVLRAGGPGAIVCPGVPALHHEETFGYHGWPGSLLCGSGAFLLLRKVLC